MSRSLIPALLLVAVAPVGAEVAPVPPAVAISVAYEDAQDPPWTMPDGTGLDLDLLRQAVVGTGATVTFRPTSWKRCLSLLQEGKVDAVLPVSWLADRGRVAAFPVDAAGQPDPARRLHLDGYHLYRRTGTTMSWDGERLTGVVGAVAAQPGYSVVERLRQLSVEVDDSTTDLDLIIRKLVAGRVQVAALQTLTADARLLRTPGAIVKCEPALVPAKAYYLAFSLPFTADHAPLAEAIWRRIAEIRSGPAFSAQVERALAGP